MPTEPIYVINIKRDDSPQDDYEYTRYTSESDARNRDTPRGATWTKRTEPFLALCSRGDHVAEATEIDAEEAADEVRRERENARDIPCDCDPLEPETPEETEARLTAAEDDAECRAMRAWVCPRDPIERAAFLTEARRKAREAEASRGAPEGECGGECPAVVAYTAETERLAKEAADKSRAEYARDFVRISDRRWRDARAAYIAFPDTSPASDFDTAEMREKYAAHLANVDAAVERLRSSDPD